MKRRIFVLLLSVLMTSYLVLPVNAQDVISSAEYDENAIKVVIENYFDYFALSVPLILC